MKKNMVSIRKFLADVLAAALLLTISSVAYAEVPVQFRDTDVGDIVTFGRYEQDNITANGKEPIEWLVLAKEKEGLLLISRYGLDYRPYHGNPDDFNWETHPLNWEECDLRAWLNSDFLEEAFSREEQAQIPTVTVSADANPYDWDHPDRDTRDRVFLLSISEAIEYFKSGKHGDWSGESLYCIETPYTAAKQAAIPGYGYDDPDGYATAWLFRTTYGGECTTLAFRGTIVSKGWSLEGEYVIRPALWIEPNGSSPLTKVPRYPEQVPIQELKNAEAGDYITFGSYEQDNVKKYGKEPIVWLVLKRDGDRILVISRLGLDCQCYKEDSGSPLWEDSPLRSWLNKDFLYSAFTDEERAKIPTVTVSADRMADEDLGLANSTDDKIFLLSVEEANEYFRSDEERRCIVTRYARAAGCHENYNGFCWWWLRPQLPESYADSSFVKCSGSVCARGIYGWACNVAVRPAMWIEVGAPERETAPTSAPPQKGIWSEWSDWSTKAVESSATREVEKRQTKAIVGYHMFRYQTRRQEDKVRMFRDYSIEGNYGKYKADPGYEEHYDTKYVTVSQMDSATSYPPDGSLIRPPEYNGHSYDGLQMGNTDAYNFGDDNQVWFIQEEACSVTTEYRYRDLLQ